MFLKHVFQVVVVFTYILLLFLMFCHFQTKEREREMIFSITDLHSFTAATPRSPVMFMWGAVLLHPERMCPILNKTCWICWDLHKRNKNKWKNSRKPFVIQATKGIGKSKIPNISFILCSCISGCCNIPVATWILKFTL